MGRRAMCGPQRVASFLRAPRVLPISGRGNLGLKFRKLRFHLSTPRISRFSENQPGPQGCLLVQRTFFKSLRGDLTGRQTLPVNLEPKERQGRRWPSAAPASCPCRLALSGHCTPQAPPLGGRKVAGGSEVPRDELCVQLGGPCFVVAFPNGG